MFKKIILISPKQAQVLCAEIASFLYGRNCKNWNTFKLRSHTIGTALSEPVPTACARVIHSFLIASTAITARIRHTVVHDCKEIKRIIQVPYLSHNFNAMYFVIHFYFILTDLPTEIRKTSAMMKSAKENWNELLLFHIIGVSIRSINQPTCLILLEQISLIYFCRKLIRLFTSNIAIGLYHTQVTNKAHEPYVCNFLVLSVCNWRFNLWHIAYCLASLFQFSHCK